MAKKLTKFFQIKKIKSKITKDAECETVQEMFEDCSAADHLNQNDDIIGINNINYRVIFDEISRLLSPDQWKLLGRHLGLNSNVLMDLEKESTLRNHGREMTIILMLEKWQQITNPGEDQIAPLLMKALKTIGRNDIIGSIQKGCQAAHHSPLTKLQKEMQEKQQITFRNLLLPRFLWLVKKWLPLEELFVELTMKSKNKLGKEDDKHIAKEEIFNKIKNKIPKRILIEGHPGYGKTTLVAKLLSDWSRGEKYITDRFDLVFLIPLRNYKGNLAKDLLQQCREIRGTEDEKLQAIKAIEQRVLLLLDGLDEIPNEVKESLLPLFRGDHYRKMVVVVTCRTGFGQMDSKSDEYFEIMKMQGFEKHSFWDKRIQIEGISPERRREFLRKYLNVDDEKLKLKFSEANLELSDLYECPLFLLLLAVLVQEKEVRPIKTKTDLYKTIFNFVINRSLEKLKGQKKEFDVFDLKRESDEFGCQQLLINFGRLCLGKLKTQSLLFEESELIKCSSGNGDENLILNLGFLSKQISFFNYEEKEYYEPIHKSFLEFLAAFFLSSSDEMEREIQELMFKFNILPNDDQLLYPFLGGFLQSKAYKLFNALSAYKSIISIFKDNKNYSYNVENVLLEIPQTEETLKSLECLPTGSWRNVRYKESLHGWINGVLQSSQKRSEEIELEITGNLDVINALSAVIKINILWVNISYKPIKMIATRVQCRNLHITITDGTYKDYPGILTEIIGKIKAEKIWLTVICPRTQEKFDDFINMFKIVSRERFHHCKLHLLAISHMAPSLFSLIFPSICDLIQNGNIEYGLYIHFTNGDVEVKFRKELSVLEETVFKSHLMSFGVQSIPFCKTPLAFPMTFFKTAKQMQFIGLRGSFTGINVDDGYSFSVEHLFCNQMVLKENSSFPKFLLQFKYINRLYCNGNLIIQLCHYSLSFVQMWEGFKTIEGLVLYEEEIEDRESFLKGISLFMNVREISLIRWSHNDFVIDVISGLCSLQKLRYVTISNSLLDFLERLLELNDKKGRKKLSFHEMEFRSLSIPYEDSAEMNFIKSLENCFLESIFLKFSVVQYWNDSYLEQLSKYFICKEEFEVYTQWVEEPRCNCVGKILVDEVLLDESPRLIHQLVIELKKTKRL